MTPDMCGKGVCGGLVVAVMRWHLLPSGENDPFLVNVDVL